MRLFFTALALLFFATPALAEPPPPCQPIASVFGTPICETDIAITKEAHDNLKQYAEKNGKNAKEAEFNIRQTNLFSLIWEKALIHKFGAAALEPTAEEKSIYVKAYRASMKEQYGYDKELSATIKQLLEANTYSPEIYQKLNRLGAQKQKAVMMYEKRDLMPPEMKARIDEGEAKVAEAMVKGWKVKKLLYETYGGRIAFRETEMEPVDAYQKFLDELRADSNTIILNDVFKNVFSTMENYLAAENVIVPSDAPEVKEYFAAPGWLYSSRVGQDVFMQIKQQLLAMPHTAKTKEAP